uniref:PH domain-containing protein n=1 Tax=Glossina austeni TaxID=7395 RepID=A0A1A9V8W5_GLOAU
MSVVLSARFRLEAPPLFTAANMDAKKLHQLQQSQNVQKKLPLAYQTNIADYRTATHSPTVFQQQQQLNYHMSHVPSGSSNTAALTAQYQQSPTTTSSSGPLSPIDIQPQANKLLLKHQVTSGSGGNTSSSAHSSPYHQPSTSSGYPTSSGGTAGNSEQLYQSPTERTYLAAAGRLQASHNPATTLQQQYQQLQQAKLQAQLQTQNEAIQHQHRTFALRQAMNPPVPQGHYHTSQSSSMVSSVPQQSVVQQQMASQQQQRAPPSSLTLSNQFQPASGPLKVNQQQQAQHSAIAPQGQQHFHHHPQQQVHRSQEQIYGQHQHQQLQMQLHHQQQLHQQQQHQQQHYHPLQQRSKSDLQTPSGGNDQSPVYIQQNHPGHVVNQACQTQISAVVKTTSQTTQNTKTPSSEDSSSASAKSPTHHPVDRKKSSGGSNSSNTQALKSPLTKRPPSSPVTISGWLYKQGSDGLKVWRKRWFVLAEYCLYYYKGPEEEKLLGSILLPSYKVSACLPEDKIYRKYAFKCEHQNMRTYWLAAENPESMVQWVRALSAATMMQASASGGESSEQPSVSSSSANQSGENSDSGIHTLQSQQSKLSSQGQVTPASDSGKNQATNGNSGGGGGVQPLYANAPPKPRRITDGGYSSPSPEHSIDNERRAHQQQQQHQQQHQFQPSATSRRSGIMSPTLQQMQQQQQQQQYAHTNSGQTRPQHHAIYDTRTGNVSSALRVQQAPTQQYQQQQQSVYNIDHLETQYQQQMSLMNDEHSKTSPGSYMDAQMEAQIMQLQQQRAAIGDDIYGERELYMQRLIQQRYPAQAPNYGTNNAERRTPDAYGRSKNRIFSDYEDIYNFTQPGNVGATNVMSAQEALIQEAASYRRPLSPPTYDGHKHVPSIPSLYATNHLEHSSTQNAIGSNSNLRARPAAAIIRPHSADFLEYEARNDIATTDALPTPATTSHLTHMVKPDPVRAPRPKSSLDINRTPDSFYYSEENYAEKMRKSALYLQHPQGQTALAQPQQAGSYRTATGSTDFLAAPHNGLNTIGYENPYERAYKRSELMQDALINQTGHTSIPRMSRSQMIGAGSHVRSSSTHPHTPQSPTIHQSNLLTAGLTTQQIIQQNEQFLRSASARLPKRTGTFDDEPNSPPPPADASPPPVVGTNNNAPASHLDGERKREESMKRLLEWKQRMLQSPLTRKGAQAHSAALNSNSDNNNSKNNVTNVSKLGSNPNILLSSTTVASGAHYPIKKASNNANVSVGLQRSRSETHANSGHGTGYNSYSSDDEDTQAGGIKQKAPAGRSSLRASTKINARQHTNTVNNDVATTTIITTATTTATTNLKLKKTIAIVEPSVNPIVQTSNPGSAINLDKTLATQTQKILKPILKTKIINVKPVVQDQEDKTTDPTSLLTKPNTALSLPKTANAIDIIPPPEEEDKKQSCSPSPCSSPVTSASTYIPVYNTKTLSLSKIDTFSGENNDFTSEIVAENVDSPLSPNKPLETDVEISSSSDKEVKETFFNETQAINDADATPMLMNLKMFKEQEEERKKLLRDSSTAEERKISEAANNVQESAEDEEDEDTACEYTDDDLDEALAVEADVEEETTLDSSQIDCDLPDSKECSQIYENDAIISTLEDSINLDESHYLPMTPKRTEFNISSNSKFPLIALSNVTNAEEEEENHYVEMTKLLQDDDSKSNYEIMCISSSQSPTTVSGTKPKQMKIQNEPLYMELPVVKLSSPTPLPKKEELPVIAAAKTSTLKKTKKSSETFKKKSKKSSQERSQSKRKDLPDILKPSQSKLASNSDSSDADDESSKQMDSKKMRSRSRFSLSDTFRPASYYLGASTPLADCAESSDSEIVSPPPIPNSPPPLEELKTEEIFSAENYDTVKRRNSGSTNNKFNLSYDTLTKIHASNSSLNIPKTEATLKSSRLSLPDQFCKVRSSGGQVKATNTHILKHHERTLSDSNYGFQTDNSSNASSDFDLYNKLKQNSPSYIATPTRYQSNNSLIHKYMASTPGTGNSSETDSVELRQRQGSDTELERHRSRRPLSEESISEIESLSEKFEDVLGAADLDTYLNDLQNSDLYLYQNTKFDKVGNLLTETPSTTKQGSFSLGHLIKPPKIFRTKEDEHFYGNIHFVSSTDSLQKLVSDSKDNRRRELQSQETVLEDPSDILGASSLTPTRYMTPLHSRNSSNISEQSAPYYYSELSRSRELINTPTITLNNQKDIHAAGSNIAHIHNPIQRATNINVDILTDKEQTIDSKNLYKMKTNVEKLSYSTGKNLKTGEPFQQASSSNQPFHIKQMESAQMKINNYQTKLGQAIPFQQQQQQQQQQQHLTVNSNTTSPMQLSQSIALSAAVVTQTTDLMVAVDKNTKITNIQKASGDEVALQTNPATENTNRSNQASKLSVLGNPVSGELLWEEDTLWRESLRRVSQRHARSLDDLDRIIVAPPTIVAYEAADAQHLEGRNKSRLSRDVTYVNDNVSQQLRSSFKHRLSEPKTICDVAELPDEHDVYVQLTENPLTSEDVNPAELYEVLREETGSNISSNKSAEIDRETIRQWDSMSSGLMKNYTSINNVETNVLSNSMKTVMEQTGNDNGAASTGGTK